MESRKDSLEYWMGSIDATLKGLDTKLDTAIQSVQDKQKDHEERLEKLEEWKVANTARTGVVAAGTALTAPPFLKWLLDFFGG